MQFFFLLLACLNFSAHASSVVTQNSSVVQEVLSETVPTAFAPTGKLDAQDYSVEWIGPALPGVHVSLGKKSLQWVRVLDVLVIPRARLIVDAENAESGLLLHAGYSQVFHPKENKLHSEIPVALISAEQNDIRVVLKTKGRELSGRLMVKFKPRVNANYHFIDPSCSKFDFSVSENQMSKNIYSYFGCRLIASGGIDHPTSTLEVYAFIDNVGQSIEINKIKTPTQLMAIWPLHVSAESTPIELSAENYSATLQYKVADHLKRGLLGVGLGPYAGSSITPNQEWRGPAPMATLYASYILTDSTRLTAFDATTLSPHSFTDFGLYLNTETNRAIDKRLGINFLLGAHMLGFSYKNSYYVMPSAPQGVELIYTDAFLPGYNLSFGAFLYPKIRGTSYSNVWLRWGAKIFVEFNYISWDETVGDDPIFNQSYGVSVGLPVAHF